MRPLAQTPPRAVSSVRPSIRDDGARAFDAAIFDLDGVVTDTAAVHAAAWKQTFDAFLLAQAESRGEPFQPFSLERDYRAFVDGRPRYDGVASFLGSRGVTLPRGASEDPADAPTVCGLGNRKNAVFNRLVETEGVRVFASTVRLIQALREAGIRVGLATSSRNAALILARARLTELFATVVDGTMAERLALPGKPEPATFLAAAANLQCDPRRAIIFEDAAAGVQAGARGGFALVVGVARSDNAAELQAAGADVIVPDLAGLTVDELDRKVRLGRESA